MSDITDVELPDLVEVDPDQADAGQVGEEPEEVEPA